MLKNAKRHHKSSIVLRSSGSLLLGAILASCGSAGVSSTSATTGGQSLTPVSTLAPATTSSGPFSNPASTLAPTNAPISGVLPLGDGKVLYGSSQVGYIDACGTLRNNTRRVHGGPWINYSNSTWTPSQKVAVQGANYYPNAYFNVSVSNGTRTIATDSVPVGMPVGNFPISPNDPAYQYDTNPNHIVPKALSITVPASPTVAQSPSCLPMGAIGVLTNGVMLFNALDAGSLDAVAHETQDSCGGHPDHFGTYHYHDISPCILAKATGQSTLVGYALDGFGIYVERNANGSLVTNSQLDACHGRVSPVLWDGKTVNMYHYDATSAYPYTIGCFVGTVTPTAAISIGDPLPAFSQRQG
ncbi:YHYH protein [Acidithrix sp. C25]|uniref:YHYH protein n=1 Tax=Acidithrix sp. C25 TaxID=1671482 RepID=UPI00191B9663|nr:YHYH protein [Acidithrix sp. C25]